MRDRTPAQAGFSVLELMLAITLGTTVSAIAVPAMMAGLDHARVASAANYVSGTLLLARMEAVKRSANVAVRFEPDGGDYAFFRVRDGNGNGVRSADIAGGIDPSISARERLAHHFPGVSIAFVPGVPPIDGAASTDAVRFGASSLASFSASGSASSGTVYLRSRSGRQFAVRVLGVTGRTRLFEFNPARRQWVAR